MIYDLFEVLLSFIKVFHKHWVVKSIFLSKIQNLVYSLHKVSEFDRSHHSTLSTKECKALKNI